MNMKLKRFLPPLALLLALTGTGLSPRLANAEGGGHGRMFAKLKELGLSPEQKEKIQAIRKSGKEKMQKLREDAKSAHQKLAEAHQKDASKAELTQLFNTAQEKRQEVAKQRFAQAMEIRDVLTAEQRKKAGAMMGEFFEKRGGKGRPDSHGHDADDEE